MASVTRDDIKIQTALVEAVKLSHQAQPVSASISTASTDPQSVTIKSFHPSFSSVIGETPTFSLLVSADASRNPFFHKGCAYVTATDELYATSDLLQSSSSSRLPVVLISKLSFRRSSDLGPPGKTKTSTAAITSLEWMKLRPPSNMAMPAGAIPYEKGVLYCSQGTLEANSGGLFHMPLGKPPVSIVANYFGRPFNSVQGVVKSNLALWFTDSCAGFEQEIRPPPQLPCHVYWFSLTTGELRVVVDGLQRPTGIALSPNQHILYVTDTEAASPGNSSASTSPATIYAYDIILRTSASPCVMNKRVFAFAFSGVPAAITCDPAGNVYAACADGVEVWNSEGTALGLIQIPSVCSSLCFGREGELFVCGGQTLWRVQLNGAVFHSS